MFTVHEITNRFGDHAAKIEGPNPSPRHHDIRQLFVMAAGELDALAPDNDAKEEAFKRFEEASMWFHKSLAPR